jgi:hypothetical protein
VAVAVDGAPGWLVIIGYFADHPFSVGGAPSADMLRVVIEVPTDR